LAQPGELDVELGEHETAGRLDPDGYEVNAAAARCYIGLRCNVLAIGCLERVARAIETDFRALGTAIQCCEAVGDAEDMQSAARRCLERVEKLIVAEPDPGLGTRFGANALVARGETGRANEWAARALLLDPDNTNLTFNLACAMVGAGRPGQGYRQSSRRNAHGRRCDRTLHNACLDHDDGLLIP
jgi:adenylate cyclase